MDRRSGQRQQYGAWSIAFVKLLLVAGLAVGLALVLNRSHRAEGIVLLDSVLVMGIMVVIRGCRPLTQIMIGLVALGAVVGVELLLGLNMVLAGLTAFLGATAVAMLMLYREEPQRLVSSEVGIAMLTIASTVALAIEHTRPFGAVAMTSLIALIAFTILSRVFVPRLPRWRRAGAALLAVAVVLTAAGSLSYVGHLIRNSSGYARIYGTPVTVDILGNCERLVRTENGLPVDTLSRWCNATWQIGPGSEQVFGRLFLPPEGQGTSTADGISAYASGERAFDSALTTDGDYAPLGRYLPGWGALLQPAGIVGLLVVVVSARRKPDVDTTVQVVQFKKPRTRRR